MRGIGLYIVAVGFVVAGALVPLLRRSRHPVAKHLLRHVGPQPSGVDGRWRRRDHVRAAGWHTAVALGLWVVALAIFQLADRWQLNTPQNTAISLPGVALFFGGIVALWFAGRSLLRAAIGYAGPARHSAAPTGTREGSRPAI